VHQPRYALHVQEMPEPADVFGPDGERLVDFADDEPVVDGRIAVGDIPGIGIERKPGLLRIFKDLAA